MSNDSKSRTEQKPTDRRALLAGIGGLAAGSFLAAGRAEAGSLQPPGVPEPTMKRLDEVEPRVVINEENTPGDDTAVVRITQPGSYYLTGNLLGESGKHGISIEASNVSIDLMGFALLGVSGSLQGIGFPLGFSPESIVVRNGTVRDWGEEGIRLGVTTFGSGTIVEGVCAVSNGGTGITVGRGSVVRGCVAEGNDGGGISGRFNTTVSDCIADGNSSTGFFLDRGSTVANCSAESNGSSGIRGSGSTIIGCSVSDNDFRGIDSTGASVIANCSAVSNNGAGINASHTSMVVGCVTSFNAGDGIQARGRSSVCRNHCSENGSGSEGAGIRVSDTRNLVEDNQCTANVMGIQVAHEGNFIARNRCTDNAMNWDIAAGNKCLVIDGANAGVIRGDSGGVSPGSTDPNANFTY